MRTPATTDIIEFNACGEVAAYVNAVWPVQSAEWLVVRHQKHNVRRDAFNRRSLYLGIKYLRIQTFTAFGLNGDSGIASID